MTSYVFPGQGSQSLGMGRTLFTDFPDLVEQANEILGYSIVKLCLEDPEGKLNQTNFTQPALFVVNALSYLNKIKENEKLPQYVAGHSLGEYNALFAARVFDFATGLKLVQKRGKLMSQATQGAMAAVIGLKSEDVLKLIAKHHLNELAIANYNSYTQVVITGLKTAVLAAETIFTGAGALYYLPLNVSGAFHSKYMDDAQQEFSLFMREFHFAKPIIPIIANMTAKPYPIGSIHTLLAQQITHPVHWTQTVEYLLLRGETDFEEIGPGRVLSSLIARIRKGQ
ncbi:MAG: ACP S-malonyltransferase [Gammaproteobacteria bacterium]|nr:ACP S-malonyltransferase [Gammaproteobacteria bacterium]